MKGVAMTQETSWSRRRLLQRLALGVSLAPLAARTAHAVADTAPARNLPPLSESAAEARAVHYVEDAHKAKDASAGATCANCSLYQGADGSTQGPCQIFPGKSVKAAGWCSSWAAQM
jgi:hypothetical protein